MVGFEPTICFRIRVLQTRSLSHSDTCSVAEVGFEPTRAFRPKGLKQILGTIQSCLYYPPV